VDRRKLQLVEPIKKLGEYDVPLRLSRDVVAHIKVRVVAEGSKAK
jgi:large subunit ribosomal protein L9